MGTKFKKYFFFFALAFIATVLAVFKFSSPSQNPTPSPAPPSIQPVTWNGITPGKTTVEQIKTIPGAEEKQNPNGQTLITIPRKEQGLPHEIIIYNNTVGLIKDRVLSGNISSFIQKFGPFEGEYWGEHQEVGFKTYVFAQGGLAVVANKEDGSVFEVWYFQPMDLANFLASWGKDLNVQKPNKGY